MGRIGYIDTQCHWCRRPVQFSKAYYPRRGEQIGFLRCECGAVGLASCDPQGDWPRVVDEVLGQSPGEVEQWKDDRGYKLPSGKDLREGVDEQRYLILWGRRKEH